MPRRKHETERDALLADEFKLMQLADRLRKRGYGNLADQIRLAALAAREHIDGDGEHPNE